MPRLSVLVPVYNAEKAYIRESVASLRIAAPRDTEILIGLDGRCSPSVIREIEKLCSIKGGPVIKLLELPKRGISATLNTLIESSDSKWIARHDADDICLPNRFDEQVKAMESSHQAAFCGTQICRCDAQLRPFKNQRMYPKTHMCQLLYSCSINNPLAHPTLFLSREKLSDQRYEEIQGAEDWALYLRLWERGHESFNLSSIGILYRVHPHQITAHKRSRAVIDQMKKETVRVIRKSGRRAWLYESFRRGSRLLAITELGLAIKNIRERQS